MPKLDPSFIVPWTERGSEVYDGKTGMYYRSEYELQVAKWLREARLFALYEQFGFRVRHGLYVPDFYLSKKCFIEVKGRWGASQKLKTLNFRDTFPEYPLLVLTWLIHGEFYDKRDRITR